MTPLQDSITLHPPPSASAGVGGGGLGRSRKLLIFFICGNPGLIEYYHAFLHHLHQILLSTHPHSNITIHGASHPGFELHSPTPRSIPSHAPPYSLREEIESVKVGLWRKIQEMMVTEEEEEQEEREGSVDVVLMGHSVGAYMLLEVVEWWWQQRQRQHGELVRILAGVCLFPTVVDLAKSPRGQVLSWFLPALPFLPRLLQGLAKALARIPTTWIDWPKFLHPGTQAREVTEAMIRSPNAVRQVISMARDEMREIKGDMWHPAHVWGVGSDDEGEDAMRTGSASAAEAKTRTRTRTRTKLFFYWGKNDYWVNNQSRDALITARAQTTGMFIDPGEIPHTFSLETEDMMSVAGKVAEWIAELQQTCK